jgi:hypothetical protein
LSLIHFQNNFHEMRRPRTCSGRVEENNLGDFACRSSCPLDDTASEVAARETRIKVLGIISGNLTEVADERHVRHIDICIPEWLSAKPSGSLQHVKRDAIVATVMRVMWPSINDESRRHPRVGGKGIGRHGAARRQITTGARDHQRSGPLTGDSSPAIS